MKKIISLAVLCAFSFANEASAAGLAPEDFNQMYALAHNGEVYALRGSVQRGLNIDSLDKYGNTGLCVSIYRNDQRAYNTFRAAGANPKHPCTQNIPTARYESFMSSSRVVAVNETPRQAFNVIHTGFIYSPNFWKTALTGVAGITAIALAGGGGGGGSSAVEETPLLAGDKSLAIISGTKKLEPLVDEDTGEKTEQNLIGKIYYNDVETLDVLPEISSVTSAIDILERGYTITKMPLSLAQNFGVYFKVTNGASVNSYTVPEVSAGQIGMVVQGYKTEYRDETIIETDDEGNEVEKTIKVPYTKVSSLKNHSKIDVFARNGAIGMVAGNYAEATNLNEIELKLEEGGTFKNAAIVGMYGDTGSSIFNESNISGHMEPAAGSGSGSIIGMMLSFVSKITDKLPTYDDEEEGNSNEVVMKATNSGTISLESNNANTIGLVGMGSYLASNMSPASSIGSAILENTGNITITHKATNTSEGSQSSPISLVGGQGLVGGMGMRADAKTTAINSNRITIIGGQNSAAGMVAVNGGKIQNDKEIIIGDGTTVTSAFGMAALNGTRRGYISEIINNGTINLKAGTSGSKAIYIEGQTKVTLGENSKIDLNSYGQSVIYNGNQDGTALGTDSSPITLNGTITLNGAANVSNPTPQYVLEGNFGKVENKGTITFTGNANGSLLYQNGKMGTFTNSGTIIWNSALDDNYDLDYLLDANEFVNKGTFTLNRKLFQVGYHELAWLIKGSNVNKDYISTGNISINNSDSIGGIAIINDSSLKDSSSLTYDGTINVPGNGIYTKNVGTVSFKGSLISNGGKYGICSKNVGSFTNSGTITGKSLQNGIYALGTNINTSTFTNESTGKIDGNAIYGIYVDVFKTFTNNANIGSFQSGGIMKYGIHADNINDFTNTGDIFIKKGNGGDSAVMGIYGYDISNTFKSTGDITLDSSYAQYGIYLQTEQPEATDIDIEGNIDLTTSVAASQYSYVAGIDITQAGNGPNAKSDANLGYTGDSNCRTDPTKCKQLKVSSEYRNAVGISLANIMTTTNYYVITVTGKASSQNLTGIDIATFYEDDDSYAPSNAVFTNNGQITINSPQGSTGTIKGINAKEMKKLTNNGDIIINATSSAKTYGIYADGSVAEIENNGVIGNSSIAAGTRIKYGIYVEDTSSPYDTPYTPTTITNKKSIWTSNTGIFAHSDTSNKKFIIDNTATIGSSSDAIYVNADIIDITNSGQLTVTGTNDGSYGAGIRASGRAVTITNSGTINSTANGTYGINVNTNNGTATITNTAEKIETTEAGIRVENTNDATVTNEGNIIADGNALVVIANKFAITNTASLEGHGTNNGPMSTALGIGLVATHTGKKTESSVENSGNIINSNYGIIARILLSNIQNSKINVTNSATIGKETYGEDDIQLRVGIEGYAKNSANTITISTTANSNIYVNTPGGAYAPAIGILAGAELTTLNAVNTDKIQNYTNTNYVNNDGNITATVNSAGAGAYGIYVYKGGTDTDEQSHSVINSGDITINAYIGNVYGIYINSGTVKNEGNITINDTGNISYGIHQDNGSTVLNTGSISGAIYGISSAMKDDNIYIYNGASDDNENAIIKNVDYGLYVDITNSINNLKNITMINNGTIKANKYGMSIGGSNGTVNLENKLTFKNAGTINVGVGAIGMYIDFTGTASNSGTINVVGATQGDNISTVGVRVNSATDEADLYDGNFTNEEDGIIEVSGNMARAIQATTGGTITNNGTIKVNGDNNVSAIMLTNDSGQGAIHTKINNAGTIYLRGITAANGIYSQNYFANRNSGKGTINIVKGTGLTKIDNAGTINIAAGFTDFDIDSDEMNTTGAESIGILNANNLSGGKLNISSNIDNSNNSILKEDVTASGYTFTGPIGMKQSGGNTDALTILHNQGTINVAGNGAIGTWAENLQDVYNDYNGIINVSGEGAVGMVNDGRKKEDTSASVTANNGSIYVTGEGAAGMFTFGGNGSIRNKFEGGDSAVGNIIVSGNNSYGMYATGAGSSAINEGKIWVTGENSYGMFADNGATATNNGTIYVTGAGSYGMRATNGGTVVNNGTISVYGENANGAGGIWATGATNSTGSSIYSNVDITDKNGKIYIERTSGDGQTIGVKLENNSTIKIGDMGIAGNSQILIKDTRDGDDNYSIGIKRDSMSKIEGTENKHSFGKPTIIISGKNNIGYYYPPQSSDSNAVTGKIYIQIPFKNENNKASSSPTETISVSRSDVFPSGEAPKEDAPTPPDNLERFRAALAAALNIPEEDLELVFEDEDSDESLSAAAEGSSEDSSSGRASLEDSIFIDENSTFINNGTLLTDDDINFDNLTKAKGSSFQVTSSSIIAGNSFSGNVVANAEIVMTDENLREYSTENSFLGEDNGLTVTSGSYMFDASTQDNEGSIGIVMSMRDFNDIMEDKKLGDYLSSNYDNGNRVAMFNRMKVATHKAQYDKIVNDELGLDFVPSLAKQNMDFNRDFTAQLNDEIFENLKNSRKDFITGIQYYHHRNSSYDGLEGYKSNGSNLYSLYNEDVSNTVNYGLGMSIGTNTSKFDDDSSTYQAMAQVYVPVALSSGDTTFVTMPQFGAGYGRYKRKVEGDKTHRANISSYTYGVSNQLRRGFEFEGLTIEPVAEINVLGLYSGKIKEKDNMFVKSQNAVSIEGGLGLYLGKSIEYANSSTLRLRFGGTYYREMNNPYQRISAGFADADGYYNMHGYSNSRDRGVISLKADYGWKQFNFYVKAAEYIEKNSNFSLQGGMNYKF